MDVRFFLCTRIRVAAVAIDASKVDGAFFVRITGILMALNATEVFGMGLALCLS